MTSPETHPSPSSSTGVENGEIPLFFVNVPYSLGVYVVENHLSVRTEEALRPLNMFPAAATDPNSNGGGVPAASSFMFDFLKDYLGHFALPAQSVFPLYSSINPSDPLFCYRYLTLEAFLLVLFTKVPSNLISLEPELRKRSVDFIRKSLNVMISFLQVKQVPPGVTPHPLPPPPPDHPGRTAISGSLHSARSNGPAGPLSVQTFLGAQGSPGGDGVRTAASNASSFWNGSHPLMTLSQSDTGTMSSHSPSFAMPGPPPLQRMPAHSAANCSSEASQEEQASYLAKLSGVDPPPAGVRSSSRELLQNDRNTDSHNYDDSDAASPEMGMFVKTEMAISDDDDDDDAGDCR